MGLRPAAEDSDRLHDSGASAPTTTTDAGAAASSVAAVGTDAGAGTDAAASTDAASDGGLEDEIRGGGCHCQIGGSGEGASAPFALVVAGAVVLRRRRLRRRS